MRLIRTMTTATTIVAMLAAPASTHAGSLRADLARLVRSHPMGAVTSVDVRRAGDDSTVYEHRARRPVTPASNEKLYTDAATLALLGPAARLRTRVALTGRRQGVLWRGDLYLVGGGDPTLSTAAFARRNYRGRAALVESLVDAIAARGIVRVHGDLVVDESLFDTRRYVDSWPARFRFDEATALGALTVNQSYLGVELDGIASREPALRAGFVLRTQLAARGVLIDGATRRGVVPVSAETVGTVESPPVRSVVRFMARTSDNFTAEILLKQLAAQFAGRGTTTGGVRTVRDALAGIGVPCVGVRNADGSGLSSANRTSVQRIADLLEVMDDQPVDVRDAFLDSLAISGRAGTLHKRLRGARGRVIAKTGTLRESVALSGFTRARDGRRYVFSIVTFQRGGRIPATSARRLHDAIATRLAS